jgi:hypothetical protein
VDQSLRLDLGILLARQRRLRPLALVLLEVPLVPAALEGLATKSP